MAFNKTLAERIEQELTQKNIPFEEKIMFGGIAYMVDDKMCLGIIQDQLMARVDPTEYEQLLLREGAKEMTFTGKSMKGYIYVDDDGWDADSNLLFWIDKCLAYNPKAKSSKKR